MGLQMHHSMFKLELCMQIHKDSKFYWRMMQKSTQEIDVEVVDICKINMYLQCKILGALVLGGVLILASSTLQLPPWWVGLFQHAMYLAQKIHAISKPFTNWTPQECNEVDLTSIFLWFFKYDVCDLLKQYTDVLKVFSVEHTQLMSCRVPKNNNRNVFEENFVSFCIQK